MRRAAWVLLGVALVTAVLADEASAQVPYGRRTGYGYVRPSPVSPYLDLLQGRNLAVNYYLGTRSEFQRQAAFQDLRRLERQFEEFQLGGAPFAEEGGLPATGHPTGFMYYSHYYDQGLPRTAPAPRRRY
jgi:hypothetical protein